MKILKCKPGHSVHIVLKANVDPAMPVDYLFGHSSGIDIYIGQGQPADQEIRLAVQAPEHFYIVHRKQLA